MLIEPHGGSIDGGAVGNRKVCYQALIFEVNKEVSLCYEMPNCIFGNCGGCGKMIKLFVLLRFLFT